MSDKQKTGGEIDRYFRESAPKAIQEAIRSASKKDIINTDYPFKKRMGAKEYDTSNDSLQIELVKLQSWVKATGQRVAIVFEGRDAAGKGGTIKRFRENLNPRGARVVALSKPSDTERTEWYFQRYIQHLPHAGEIVFFDRSWYNRAVVEKVFGFCTDDQRARFFRQVPSFENMLVRDGIVLIKIWLTVGRAEQLRRFLARENDRLKHWKLSGIDIKGLPKWDEYSTAIAEMFAQSHTEESPWNVIRSDDKRRARLAAMRLVLGKFDYTEKDQTVLSAKDSKICGTPSLIGVEK